MKISWDPQADALYILFQKGTSVKNKKIDEDTILDIDTKGRLLGIEFLNVSRRFPLKELAGIQVAPPMRVSS